MKNRLAKRATERAGTAELDQLLVGPTALAFVKGDAVTAAKAISTFGRQHDILEYKGGLMDGAPLDPDQFTAIARLPGLDVLRGQLVGVVASPLTGLARGLASMVSGLAVALGEIAEQGLVGGEAASRGGGARRGEPTAAEEPPPRPMTSRRRGEGEAARAPRRSRGADGEAAEAGDEAPEAKESAAEATRDASPGRTEGEASARNAEADPRIPRERVRRTTDGYQDDVHR